MSNISGAGGNKVISVAAGDNLTVDSFGVFGTGATASQPAELDTLKFLSTGMSGPNMVLTQSGANVVVTFDGVANTQVTLTNVTIDQLENIQNQGNFIFAGQNTPVDTLDVISDPSATTVAHSNVVTFLTDGTYTFNGKDNSNDTIRASDGNDVIHGLSGNDRLYGGAGNDTLEGGVGNDILDGGTGNDTMRGGTGNDTYYVDNAKDVVDETGGGGIDTVVSTISYTLAADFENLTLVGTVGLHGNGNGLDNVIIGGDGNDVLGGGAGNDTLDGGKGGDLMTGGTGNDTYFVDNASDRTSETLTNANGGGIDTVVSTVTCKLGDNLDNLTLAGTADIGGTGNALDNVIIGNSGNNVLAGGDGNDTISGGAGNDTINGNAGADSMSGGAGSDNYFVDNLSDTVTETLTNASGGGIDKVSSSVSFTLGDNLDNLALTGTGNTSGAGNGLDNVITGNTGNNTLSGDGGNDTINGGDGNDIIDGGAGNDALHGGNGNDVMFAGKGDFVGGDAGNDDIRVTEAGFTTVDGGTGIDQVSLAALGATINLTSLPGSTIKNIEIIDISGGGNNTLILDAKSVAAMSGGAVGAKTLIVNDDAGDTVSLDSSWKQTGTQNNPFGQTGGYDVFTSGTSTLLIEHHGGGSGNTPVPTLDALNGTNGFRIDGNIADGQSSLSVHSAGDVNGDGINDIIVGSRDANGDAYVIYGHTGAFGASIDLGILNGTNGFHITNVGHSAGSSSGAPYGVQVSGAGDVNGDGIADFIVGAYAGSPDSMHGGFGSTYLIYGKAGGFSTTLDLDNLTAAEGVRINGVAPGYGLGTSVAAAGDVNGDGYDDLIIGAEIAAPGGKVDAGSAYVLFGHAGAFTSDLSTLDGSNGFRIDGPSESGFLGRSVSSAGDINGDGFADLIVGAPHFHDSYGGAPDAAGTAYVIFGHPGNFDAVTTLDHLGDATGFSITGPALNDQVGISVAAAGDINGDGLGDLIVGSAATSSSPAYGADATYVLYGHTSGFGPIDLSNLSPAQGFTIHGAKAGDYAGNSVSSAGDINGDGYADLLIGAPNAGSSHDTGAAYVVYGHAGGFSDIDLSKLDGSNGFVLEGIASGDDLGFPVSAAGDVNGDGFADLIVGAYLADPNGHTDAGSSYVIFGGNFTGAVAHLGTNAGETLTGNAQAESFVAGGGDDIINAGGGKDVIYAGAGNDHIHVTDGTFARVDGGGGSDTLHLDYAGAIDLDNLDNDFGTIDRGKVTGIETISMDNGLANDMSLRAVDVLEMNPENQNVGGKASLDDVLKIDGNSGDTLLLTGYEGWSAPDTSTLPGYAVYATHDIRIAVETTIAVTVN
jgi:Ca2+-binding RTX toxin-like protein